MKKFRAILLSLALVCFMAGAAAAEQATVTVNVAVAKPFTLPTTSAADFDTLYPGTATENVTMIVGALPVAKGTSSAAALAALTGASSNIRIQQGTSLRTVSYDGTGSIDPGLIYVDPAVTGLDLTAAFVSGALTQTGFGATATLSIAGTNNNFSKYLAAAPATGSFAIGAVGPTIVLPTTAEGTYAGTMTIDVTLK